MRERAALYVACGAVGAIIGMGLVELLKAVGWWW